MNLNKIAVRVVANATPRHKVSRIAARVARRASMEPLHLRMTALHIMPDDVKRSDLDKSLKDAFDSAFRAKDAFFKSMPLNERGQLDVDVVDKMDRAASSLVFALQGLVAKARESGLDIPSEIQGALSKQKDHGFIPHSRVNTEGNTWGWNAHELISAIFDVATGEWGTS